MLGTTKKAILWRYPDNASANDGAIYNWDQTTTSANPGSGKIRANNSNIGSVTELYISKTDADGNSQANPLEALRANGGRLRLRDSVNGKNASFEITEGNGTNHSLHFTLTVSSETALLPIGCLLYTSPSPRD